MSVDELQRNPLFEHAITLADLKDPLNYHSMYQGSDELCLPFMVITGQSVRTDAFLVPTNLTLHPYRQWTWNTINGSFEPADLRELGVVPWENGTWSKSYVLSNAHSFRLIERLLVQ